MAPTEISITRYANGDLTIEDWPLEVWFSYELIAQSLEERICLSDSDNTIAVYMDNGNALYRIVENAPDLHVYKTLLIEGHKEVSPCDVKNPA